VKFLTTGPDNAKALLLLAHGASAPMDNRFMNDFAAATGDEGICVLRFEFGYMASRRTGAGRKPPPKAERLTGEFEAAVSAVGADRPLFIGGKSMGGRVASMVAGGLHRAQAIAGLVCLGYPFHPPAKPQQLRTAHLADLSAPTLICQGTRDAFGTRDDVSAYALSPAITIHWLNGCDHDLRPSKDAGWTAKEAMQSAVHAVAGWIDTLVA